MQSQHSSDNNHDAQAVAEYLALTTIEDDLLENDADDQTAVAATSRIEQLTADLSKKENECEHLRQVIKQLVFSRAKLSKTSVEIQERYSQLQAEFFKACKIAQLAKSVSCEHIQRNHRLQKQIKEFSDQAHRADRQGEETRKRNLDLIAENQQMKQRLAALEQQQQNWDASSCQSTFLRGLPFPRSQALI